MFSRVSCFQIWRYTGVEKGVAGVTSATGRRKVRTATVRQDGERIRMTGIEVGESY